MSFDFAVLGRSGAPDRTVSLGMDLHYDLVTAAALAGLRDFQRFADYYEHVEVNVDDLPGLMEQVRALRAEGGSTELQHFLDSLSELIAYAVANGKALHAIAD